LLRELVASLEPLAPFSFRLPTSPAELDPEVLSKEESAPSPFGPVTEASLSAGLRSLISSLASRSEVVQSRAAVVLRPVATTTPEPEPEPAEPSSAPPLPDAADAADVALAAPAAAAVQEEPASAASARPSSLTALASAPQPSSRSSFHMSSSRCSFSLPTSHQRLAAVRVRPVARATGGVFRRGRSGEDLGVDFLVLQGRQRVALVEHFVDLAAACPSGL
jgi:hypothetical protein